MNTTPSHSRFSLPAPQLLVPAAKALIDVALPVHALGEAAPRVALNGVKHNKNKMSQWN